MIIALLAVLGVDLIVIVVFLVFVVGRKRWVTHHEGSFRGCVRVTAGAVDGLRPKWTKGYGRWVRDVLVWTKAPFLFRNELVAVDAVKSRRAGAPGEVKRLGDDVVVIAMRTGEATVEVASPRQSASAVAGPFDGATAEDSGR